MSKQVLIAGGGIGGLAAALACSRAGWQVHLFERASEFSEVGAGIQMGPNVVRVLNGWDLADRLASVAAFPERLQVRNAVSGNELGVLRLGATAVQRYGARYATIHRADLHQLLLRTVQQRQEVKLELRKTVDSYAEIPEAVVLRTSDGLELEGDGVKGVDAIETADVFVESPAIVRLLAV